MTRLLLAAMFLVVLSLTPSVAPAGQEAADISAELDRAQTQAEYARLASRLSLLADDGQDAEAMVQLGRAYYLLGEAENDKKRREGYLDLAVKESERALKAVPDDPRPLYWRSMAYLQKADLSGGISALGFVKRALKGLEEVACRDEKYDDAGACRSRGKVLMEAPEWAFIGDKELGVELLEKAREVAPDSLLNRLYLAEAYKETGRQAEALKELRHILDAPSASTKPLDDENIQKDALKLLKEIGG